MLQNVLFFRTTAISYVSVLVIAGTNYRSEFKSKSLFQLTKEYFNNGQQEY